MSASQQLLLAGRQAGSTPPPLDPNVVLLCHFDGVDGQTTSTDEYGNTLSLSGVTLSSTQFRFSPTSLFNSSASASAGGCAITVAAPLQMGSSDFTFECFGRISSHAQQTLFQFNVFTAGVNDEISFTITSSTAVSATVRGVSAAITYAFPLSSWVHVALSRQASEFKVFANGVQIGATTAVTGALPTQDRMTIGRNVRSGSTPTAWLGFIDEFRITKGIARYWSDFTPPTAPFEPNGAVTLALSGLQATAQQGIAESQNKTISLTGLQASSQVGVSATRGWPILSSVAYLPATDNIRIGNYGSAASFTFTMNTDGTFTFVATGVDSTGTATNYSLSGSWATVPSGAYPISGDYAAQVRATTTYNASPWWISPPTAGATTLMSSPVVLQLVMPPVSASLVRLQFAVATTSVLGGTTGYVSFVIDIGRI